MILKVFISSLVIVGIAVLGMGFRALFIRGGRFPQISIGKNKEMARLGISCAKHDEIKCWKEGRAGGKKGCECG